MPLGGVELTISPGVTITSATYAISGPNGFSTTGTVAIGTTANVTISVTGLPVGMGFHVDVAGVASDGNNTCTGSANFNVTSPPMSVPVIVHLTCVAGNMLGITGTTDICPALDGVDANPSNVKVGSTIALTATAHDLDSTGGPIVYAWMTTGGSLSSTTSATPTFTCTQPGSFTASVSISDSNPSCSDSLSVAITCTP